MPTHRIITKRSVCAVLAIVGLGIVSAGCGGKTDEATSTSAAPPAASKNIPADASQAASQGQQQAQKTGQDAAANAAAYRAARDKAGGR